MASSSYKYLNCSKAQMCLFKILHIISSIPPSKEEPCSSHGDDDDDRSGSFPNNNNNNNKGIGIDLNLSGESESSVIDQGNNEEGEGEAEGIRDKSVEVSEVKETQVQSFKVENNEVGDVESESKEDKDKTVSFGDSNCLDLLIEAAKVLSERDESNSEEDELKASERNELEGAVIKEPIENRKTRENRKMPVRYRDSVVEPLKRSQRQSSTSNAKKRRRLRS